MIEYKEELPKFDSISLTANIVPVIFGIFKVKCEAGKTYADLRNEDCKLP